MSDVIVVQLIASVVTLLSLYLHRLHGSKENKAISEAVNGQRHAMIARIDVLEKQLLKMTGENRKLTAQAKGQKQK
jgi:hypothetical protein